MSNTSTRNLYFRGNGIRASGWGKFLTTVASVTDLRGEALSGLGGGFVTGA